jgi:hypothetical protein
MPVGPFIEINDNLNIGKEYGYKIKERSQRVFNLVEKIANRIVNKNASVYFLNDKIDKQSKQVLLKNIDLSKNSIEKLNKIKSILINMVKKR